MADLRFRATVRLTERVIVATRDIIEFEPFTLKTAKGEVRLRLNVHKETANILWERRPPGQKNYWVNTSVHELRIEGVLYGIEDDDLQRLRMEHPTASRFHGGGKERQEAKELGQSVAELIASGCNRLLSVLESDFGQYWLRQVTIDQLTQNSLCDWNVEWRLTESDNWEAFWTAPRGNWGRAHVGVADRYFTHEDAERTSRILAEARHNLTAYSLISEAKRKWHEGDKKVATLHLNSAIEWSTQEYLRRRLANHLPDDTLEAVLKQMHGRLLDEWVLPMSRRDGLDIENNEWQGIKRVQTLRREAGHPSVTVGLSLVEEAEFLKLCHSAILFTAKVLGIETAKEPPYLEGSAAAGSAYG
jgi:hypothetical protein